MVISILGIRLKYYVGWTLGEAAVISSGQSYNGEDAVTKEPRFDRFYNVGIRYVEFGVFVPIVTANWNHGTHVWLKRYIYFRMNRHINREVAIYLTYMVSAFWHGFYPAYFAVFIFYAIYTETQKDLYKICCKYPAVGSTVGLVCVYLLTFLGIVHLGGVFTILLLSDVKHYMRGIFWPPVLYLVLFIFLKATRNFACKHSFCQGAQKDHRARKERNT